MEKGPQYETQCTFEGCYVLRTDRTELTDPQIWETYMMLSRVESAFRSLKSSLGLRPDFHQIEARADAHLFISVLATTYCTRLSPNCASAGTIARGPASVRSYPPISALPSYHVIEQNQTQRRHLRLCSQAEPEHRQIYQRLNLKEVALPRKIAAVK